MKSSFQQAPIKTVSMLAATVFVVMGISGSTTDAQEVSANRQSTVRVAERPQFATDQNTITFSDDSLSDPRMYAAPIAEQGSAAAPGSAAGLSLTLDQAIGMALQNNTGIQLAGANIRAKVFATDIARSNYFPQLGGTAGAFRFNEELGDVLRAGPLGPESIGIINQNSTWIGVIAGQPITQLWTIKQAVLLAEADRRIAQAQLQGGKRDLAYGVTQLFYGLMGAQQAAQAQAVGSSAAKDTGADRIAALQSQQAAMQAQGQVIDLQQQLNNILGVPLDTQLMLVEPPLPERIMIDVQEAISQVLNRSPEVRQAREGVRQACAAHKIAKLAYVPDVDVAGGYLNQNVLRIISENDIGFIGVTASLPILDGGKRRSTKCERQTQIAMARHNLRMVEDKARLAVDKACRNYDGAWQALQMANEILKIRQQTAAKKGAQATPDEKSAAQAAQIGVMKAEVGYRFAHAQIMSVMEGNGVPQAPGK